MATTPGGGGYWLVAADGGVFTFGDGRFWGSAAGESDSPVVGMAPTPSGGGYWVLSASGRVHAFGDAPAVGGAVLDLGEHALALAPTLDGAGIWVLTSTGRVHGLGQALAAGDGPAGAVGISTAPDGGYWVATPAGSVLSFGGAPEVASVRRALVAPVVGVATPADGLATGAAVPKRVVLYGDSLAWEARSHFVSALSGVGGVRARTSTYGGTALCDWAPYVLRDTASTELAVVSVSGNALTPCMQPGGRPPTPDEIVGRYLADAESLTAALAGTGTRVLWVGPPAFAGSDVPRRLAAGFADLAQRHPNAAYVDAGDAVAPGGVFTPTLPCATGEGPAHGCAGGVITVRSVDGGHFCPGDPQAVGGVIDGCRGWSSGAVRFGRAMAAAAVLNL
jgi:hypothetical protein